MYKLPIVLSIIKEALIKSRLTAWFASYLHIFRHIAPKFLDRRQPACEIFAQSDEKSDCAICAPDLISASLIFVLFKAYKICPVKANTSDRLSSVRGVCFMAVHFVRLC